MTHHITRQEFAKAISEGLNVTHMAIRFDVCLDTVRNWERRFGLRCSRKRSKRRGCALDENQKMREIKFRLRIGNEIVGYEKWDIGTGDNAGWFYCKNPTGKYPENVWRPDYIYHTEKDQYTGLPDKNGGEIYEGDLIRYTIPEDVPENERDVRKVIWVDGMCGFQGRTLNDRFDCFLDTETFEVIGDIYENPELLKVNK